MKKIKKAKLAKIVGGAGITGALFSGIAALFNPIANIIATTIGSIINGIHSFTDHHLKAEYKFGSASMSFDDTKQLDYDLELEKENQLNKIVKPKPVIHEADHHLNDQHFINNDQLDQHLVQNEDFVSDDQFNFTHEFY